MTAFYVFIPPPKSIPIRIFPAAGIIPSCGDLWFTPIPSSSPNSTHLIKGWRSSVRCPQPLQITSLWSFIINLRINLGRSGYLIMWQRGFIAKRGLRPTPSLHSESVAKTPLTKIIRGFQKFYVITTLKYRFCWCFFEKGNKMQKNVGFQVKPTS